MGNKGQNLELSTYNLVNLLFNISGKMVATLHSQSTSYKEQSHIGSHKILKDSSKRYLFN